MNKLTKIRTVSPAEFKHLPMMDKLYLHMMNPHYHILDGKSEAYLDELRKVFIVASENLEMKEIRKKLLLVIPEKQHYYNKYIQDAQELFGKFMTINKDFERGLQGERLKSYIKQLKDDEPKGYMEAIIKCEEQLMKLYRLNIEETEDTFDWSSLQLPAITYSDNRAFFDGTEDIEIIEDGESTDQ